MILTRPESVESYAHLAAKHVLRDWLVSWYNPRHEIGTYGVVRDGWRRDFAWKPNRPHPPHGVWTEYPWDDGLQPRAWDEVDDPMAFTGDRGLIPTVDEFKIRFGTYPMAVFDVAIQSQGRIDAAFEITWTNAPSARKRERLRGSGITVYTVAAHWVLKQVRQPDAIEYIERLEG